MRAEAFVHRDGTGTFTSDDGTVELIAAGSPDAARREVLQLATAVAARAGCAVEVEAIIAGERSLIQVTEAGEVGRTTPGEDAGDALVSETVARNDAQGLLAAGVRPAPVFDADTLASARLRMLEQTAFGAAELEPEPPARIVLPATDEPTRPAASRAVPPAEPSAERVIEPVPATVPPAPPGVRRAPRRERGRRPAVVLAGAAAVLLLGGTGIALAATGRHHTAQRPTAVAPATISSASVSPAAATSAPVSASPDTLVVSVVGRSGRVVLRAVDPSATSLTLRLVSAGAPPVEQAVDLAAPGPTTVRLTVAAASYSWTVTASDGQTRQGQVVVTPAPSSTPMPVAPTHASEPRRSATHHSVQTRSPKRTPKPAPKPSPKPKIHASVPAAPLERTTS